MRACVLLLLLVYHNTLALNEEPTVLDANRQITGQIETPGKFKYYQTSFTGLQPAGDMYIYFKVEPCSGSQPVLVMAQNDKIPDYTQYQDMKQSQKTMYLQTPWRKPLLSYLAVQSNETMDYQVQAGWTAFNTIDFADKTISVSLVVNQGKTNAVLTWRPPDKLKAYSFRAYVSKHSKKVNDNWCNMNTICGVETCGTAMNSDYTQYAIRTDGTYQESFELPFEFVDALTFQITVRSEANGVYSIYEPIDFYQQDAARIVLIIILVSLPILIVVVVGSIVSIAIYRKLREKRGLYNVVY